MKRLGLFLSAYAPLLGILAARFTTGWLVWLCAVGALVGVGLALWVLAGPYAEGVPIDVVRTDDVGEQAFTYLLTYALPFAATSEPGARDVLAYALFFAVVALVYVRSDMQQVNPIFYLFGRRITRATTKSGRCVLVVSRRRLLPGEFRGSEITAGIYLAKESR